MRAFLVILALLSIQSEAKTFKPRFKISRKITLKEFIKIENAGRIHSMFVPAIKPDLVAVK